MYPFEFRPPKASSQIALPILRNFTVAKLVGAPGTALLLMNTGRSMSAKAGIACMPASATVREVHGGVGSDDDGLSRNRAHALRSQVGVVHVGCIPHQCHGPQLSGHSSRPPRPCANRSPLPHPRTSVVHQILPLVYCPLRGVQLRRQVLLELSM